MIASGICTSADASVLRINVGGGTLTDSAGNVWKGDYGYKGGYKSKATSAIKKANQPQIYQTQRRHKSAEGELNYSIPLANGTYAVKFHFAEIEKMSFSNGFRVFDIYAEGSKKLAGIDVYKQSGGANIAMTRSVSNITVSDGKLDLKFKKVNYAALISGMEITSVSGSSASSGGSSSSTNKSPSNTSSNNVRVSKHPANQIATPGSTISLSIEAYGTGTLKYQWYYKGKAISGATSNTLRFAPVTNSDAGTYYCRVTNGSITRTTQTAKLVVSGVDPVKNSKSAMISWAAPTKRTNGTSLSASEIASYEIYHGVGSASNMEYAQTVDGSQREQLFKGLSYGNHYFSIRTVDKKGVRSSNSTTLKVAIQ